MFEFLRKVPLFADLPEEDLERLCRMAEQVRYRAGQVVFEEGAKGDRAYVIEEGRIEIVKSSAGREVLLAVRDRGEVIGELALLEESPRMASARAQTDALLVAIQKEQLDALVRTSPSAANAMFHTVLARWRATESMLRQTEKMAQLGTLTAGVAHELNNPAGAVQRGAAQLREAVERLGRADAAVARAALAPAQAEALAALAADVRASREAQRGGAGAATLDPLERSARETVLEAWLDARTVPDAWELAPALVPLGWDVARLGAIESQFGASRLGPVLALAAATWEVQDLLAEIAHGAGRIGEIVKALKSYSYLDRAPVQEVDVREGLEDTLLILRGKLKSGITVRREYDEALPKIQAYGSELNQVWTNLIDNAADALGGKGEIVLRTRRDGAWICVEIEDDGPGIPAEIQSRIFEAFFTTKPPGKGTGLGLDISWRIVVHKHRGNLEVFSRPGRTTFRVRLPIDASAAAATPVASAPRASDDELRAILARTHTIAAIGASARQDRPAHGVPAYLAGRGYRVIPVNPNVETLFGERAYADLASVPDPVDVALVIRPAAEVPAIVEQAIAKGVKTVWMQEGIVHEAAAERARAAGLTVVMDTCMRATHQRLLAK